MTVFLGAIRASRRAVGDANRTERLSAGMSSRRRRRAAVSQIFASYSHLDVQVVEELERYGKMLGDEYLRDVNRLRSGQQWNHELLRMIEEADVFQLFWSRNSMGSSMRQELGARVERYARQSFVRDRRTGRIRSRAPGSRTCHRANFRPCIFSADSDGAAVGRHGHRRSPERTARHERCSAGGRSVGADLRRGTLLQAFPRRCPLVVSIHRRGLRPARPRGSALRKLSVVCGFLLMVTVGSMFAGSYLSALHPSRSPPTHQGSIAAKLPGANEGEL